MNTPLSPAAAAIYRMTQEIRQLKQTNAELLEALEESRDFIVDHCEDMSRIYTKWELIDKIKSAIAKAKP
jgi:hypothetical protein